MWQKDKKICEVCQCSKLLKNTFQISEKYLGDTENTLSHSTVCSTYDELQYDKENQHFGSPSKHDNEISLYGNSSSPTKSRFATLCNSSPNTCNSSHSLLQPLTEFEINSQDSEYGTNFIDKEQKISFNYIQPKNRFTGCKESSKSLFNDSMEDGFLELSHIEEENSFLQSNFNSPINNSTKNETSINANNSLIRQSIRRSISLNEVSPVSANVRDIRHCLFKCEKSNPYECRFNKRSESSITSPTQAKRYKYNQIIPSSSLKTNSTTHPKIQRSFSASETTIMSALQRSSTDPNLIGDFTKPFCLPLVSGRHQDLKSISPTVLANLMRGEYDSIVEVYKIIDCRYPYEYEGGHVRDALNYYTKEQIMHELIENKNKIVSIIDKQKRNILVFHCEFSSERGPNLSRFLRNMDRTRNNDSYPALDWPEIYLLDGGYKNFYEQYSELCMPTAYKPMLHPAHENDLKQFRAKSKSWNVNRGRSSNRSSYLKRLGIAYDLFAL